MDSIYPLTWILSFIWFILQFNLQGNFYKYNIYILGKRVG